MMNFQTIPVSRIDYDLLYFIESLTPVDQVDAFDEDYFQPLWVQKKNQDTFRVIDGFRRLRQWKITRRTVPIPVIIASEDTSNLSIWKQRIQQCIRENRLSAYGFLATAARILESSDLTELDIRRQKKLSTLKIGKEKLSLSWLRTTLKKSEWFREFTDIHLLSFHDINIICEWTITEIQQMAVLLDGLRLKGNKLQSILNLIKQTVRGQYLSLTELCELSQIKECLKVESPNQRYAKLKTALLECGYPRLTNLRQNWETNLKKLNLETDISVTADPFFENDKLEFKIRAASVTDFQQKIESLAKHVDSEALIALFTLI